MRVWIVIISVIFLIFCAGCSQPEQTINVTPEQTIIVSTPTPQPAPVIIATQRTPVPTHTVPVIIAYEPVPEETAEEYEVPEVEPTPYTETDITLINFTKYLNNTDFSIMYPNTWTVSSGTFPTWSNRINSIPEQFQQDGKVVTFTSETGKTWLEARVYDWIAPGGHKLNQDLQAIRSGITEKCPDVSGDSAMSNYRFFIDDYRYDVMMYDVKMPVTSECAPLEYTERMFVSYNHLYKFDFGTKEGELGNYTDIRDTMFRSIVPEPLDVVYSRQKV